MLTVLPPPPHLRHPHPLTLPPNPIKIAFPSFQFLMFSSNTAGCFQKLEDGHFCPEAPLPSHPTLRRVFFWKPKQTFSLSGPGDRGRRVVTGTREQAKPLAASPSGPSLSPTTLGVRELLKAERKQKAFWNKALTVLLDPSHNIGTGAR